MSSDDYRTNRARYREALDTIRDAASLTGTAKDRAKPGAILLTDALDLSWSAVHTFITNVVDLGMTAQQSLADLNDAPTGALPTPGTAQEGPWEHWNGSHWVPEQPQGE